MWAVTDYAPHNYLIKYQQFLEKIYLQKSVFSLWFLLIIKVNIVIYKRIESKEMSLLLTFLGLIRTPLQAKKVETQTTDMLDDREAMKLAQLEYYMNADENQGITNLSLYL